jgi:DNA-binding transcriptional ArsR family regulator
MKARRDVFQAIADPTRRAIIQLTAAGPMDIKSLTERFDMSQQAVSLHVKVLADCGLVRMERQGRNHICRPRLEKLAEVAEWVLPYRQHWEDKLNKMEKYLEKLKKERYGKQKK